MYRPIGINRTGVTSICQIRPDAPEPVKGIEWICFGSTTFSAFLPVYTNVPDMPKYLKDVTLDTSTENFYWGSRLIDALADHSYGGCIQNIVRYRDTVAVKGRRIVYEYDRRIAEVLDGAGNAQTAEKLALEANEKLSAMAKEQTTDTLNKVLLTASENMKNGFSFADN